MKRNSYPWRRIVTVARINAGEWVLDSALVGVPHRAAAGIRLRRHPDLIHEDGALQVDPTNVFVDDVGVKRADLWVRWLDSNDPRWGVE